MALDTIDTVAQILAKAEAAGTKEEAEIFMLAAEKKAARLSLTLADLRDHTKDKREKQGKPILRQVDTGQKGMMRRSRVAELLWALANEYDVQTVAANDGSYVKMVGFKEDIEIAETLYGHLLFQMVSEGREFLRSPEFKESGAGRSDGLDNFYTGFISIVKSRVGEQRRLALSEYELERRKDDNPMALVLKDKRAEVGSIFKDEFGSIRRLSTGRAKYNRAAYGAGYVSGKDANIAGRRSVGTGNAKLN